MELLKISSFETWRTHKREMGLETDGGLLQALYSCREGTLSPKAVANHPYLTSHHLFSFQSKRNPTHYSNSFSLSKLIPASQTFSSHPKQATAILAVSPQSPKPGPPLLGLEILTKP